MHARSFLGARKCCGCPMVILHVAENGRALLRMLNGLPSRIFFINKIWKLAKNTVYFSIYRVCVYRRNRTKIFRVMCPCTRIKITISILESSKKFQGKILDFSIAILRLYCKYLQNVSMDCISALQTTIILVRVHSKFGTLWSSKGKRCFNWPTGRQSHCGSHALILGWFSVLLVMIFFLSLLSWFMRENALKFPNSVSSYRYARKIYASKFWEYFPAKILELKNLDFISVASSQCNKLETAL